MIPVPGTTSLAPNKLLIVCVEATTLPRSSATVRWVVFADSLVRARGW
jgi:hypothetical protein